MKLEYSITPYTKINSKRIKDLNIRKYTIKLLKQADCSDINHSNIFFVPSPRLMEIKTKTNGT